MKNEKLKQKVIAKIKEVKLNQSRKPPAPEIILKIYQLPVRGKEN